MKRRALFATLLLTGCSVLPSRPYVEKRSWPLDVRRPDSLPARPNGPVLLVRSLRAAPGLEARGLQTVQDDGSIRTDYYEEWSVPPADGVEDDLRRWLADSGRYAAVLAPGSRARADLALEGELQSLLALPAQGVVRASLGLVVLDLRPAPVKVLVQRDLSAEAPLPGRSPGTIAAAGRQAVAVLLRQVEQAMAGAR